MGHVQILRGVPSRAEGFDRTVRIYTPDAYDARPGERFGVLYMHDGQNVFAHPESAMPDTWCANWAIEQLAHSGRTAPWLIVGVDSGPGRLAEYSAWPDHRSHVPGHGESYARFLTDELKPWVDATYRTQPGSPSTATAGASMGGLISLYLGLSRPQVFGRIGAFSPSVMWADGAIFRAWHQHSRLWSRIYLDAGDGEFIRVNDIPMHYGDDTRSFHGHLRGLGYADWELSLVLEDGGLHHERDWQRRLPSALAWLLV
ncbi:MAG: alpha/beta hydrolase [Myxococcaceae bacterium]|nr:alpha/beta hydrolase [Myxococcaceae bacterium]